MRRKRLSAVCTTARNATSPGQCSHRGGRGPSRAGGSSLASLHAPRSGRRALRAAATAASRAATASSTVSVRSGARNVQLVRQRLAPAAELLDGVHVEQPHRLQQLAGALDERRLAPRRPAPPRPPPAPRRSAPAGSRRSPAPGRHRGGRQRVQVQLHRAGAPGQLQRGARRAGCSSPACPTTVPSTSSSRAAARVPRGVLGGPHRRSGPRGRRRRRARPGRPRPRPPSRPGGPRPTSRPARPRRPARRRRATAGRGTHRVGGGELLVGGSPVHAHRRRGGRRRDAGGTPCRSRTAPGRAGPGRGCAQRAEQRRQQRGAQQRLLLGQRVGQPHRAAGAGRRPAGRAASASPAATNG